ncbi:MAG: hypothetical protein JKY65_12485 [Planctomycetes bacterium]|nr:hypothetical protein [Planctomycetota bacterium]
MRMQALAVSAALLVCTGAPASAQDLEKKLEKKLAEKWINSPKWHTDYDTAKAEAKKSGKIIFGYFTRSYSY